MWSPSLLLLFTVLTGLKDSSGSERVTASEGENAVLPCSTDIKQDQLTVEWIKKDLKSETVLVYRQGCEIHAEKNQDYEFRTNLFMNELKHGNISLRISNVKVSDGGNYTCRTIKNREQKDVSMELIVETSSQRSRSHSDGDVTSCSVSISVAAVEGLILLVLIVLLVLNRARFSKRPKQASGSSDSSEAGDSRYNRSYRVSEYQDEPQENVEELKQRLLDKEEENKRLQQQLNELKSRTVSDLQDRHSREPASRDDAQQPKPQTSSRSDLAAAADDDDDDAPLSISPTNINPPPLIHPPPLIRSPPKRSPSIRLPPIPPSSNSSSVPLRSQSFSQPQVSRKNSMKHIYSGLSLSSLSKVTEEEMKGLINEKNPDPQL